MTMKKWGMGLTLMGCVLLLVNLWWILYKTPVEPIMGAVQKIMYWHVPPAIFSYVFFFLSFLGAVLYLLRKNPRDFRLSRAGTEIGLLCSTIVLTTGPVWGSAFWGKWWVWEPRLTTMLILWFTYLVYWVVGMPRYTVGKSLAGPSVLGVLAFINVPLVHWAVQLWGSIVHPEKVDMAREARMTLLMSTGVLLVLLSGFFLWRLSQMEESKEHEVAP